MRKNCIFITICVIILSITSFGQTAQDYHNVIKDVGEEPKQFIAHKMQQRDLIIFDDALHAAVGPFEFYCNYLAQYPESVDYVFLEVVPITAQASIDSFLNSASKDSSLLHDAFQQDFRYGWPYETYLTLFSKVWDINQRLSPENKIRIIGVDQPIYWEGLHNRQDYNLFKKSLIARDNFMYQTILQHMDNFESGKKGLFLTNTRHAYKCIKNSKGKIYWNAGTFFHEWHPGKTYSVRFHNLILYVETKKENTKNTSMEGLDEMVYKWVRMDNGKWDKAFEQNGNRAVAIPFANNIFGEHRYLGNHMADIAPGQTMYDAYDALIFWRPLEKTRFSAHTNFFYTEEFKQEVKHRVRVIHEHDLKDFLDKNKVANVSEYVEKLAKYVPEKRNPLVKSIQK